MVTPPGEPFWQDRLFDYLRDAGVDLFAYVPDSGHGVTIKRANADPDVTAIALTNEIEGVPLLAGYHLGGRRGVLLMQSSGVGNCVNMFSLVQTGRFPLLTIISMRGDFGEENSWQFPMGQGVQSVLETMGIRPLEITSEDDLIPVLSAALRMAFKAEQGVGVLLGQRLVGAKAF